jgi:outer membrane protein TolC
LEEVENQIARDVNQAWLFVTGAKKKIEVAKALLSNATQALELGKARYDSGASSIVELSQVELSKTEAEIAYASARYEYQMSLIALNFQTGDLKYTRPIPNAK